METVETVAGMLGAILSLVLKLAEEWIPAVKALDPKWKVSIALGLVASGVFVFAAVGDLSPLETALAAVMAFAVNQGTHTAIRKL